MMVYYNWKLALQQHPFIEQRPLFKAYDIRGDRQLFTAKFIHALSDELARYFVEEATVSQVVIGFDARIGSETIAKQLANSFLQQGIQVIWLGLVTTPIMAYWANQYQGHGLIATASHSEPHIIGIKWLLSRKSPSSEQIQSIYQQLATSANSISHPTAEAGKAKLIKLPPEVISEGYINHSFTAIESLHRAQSKAIGSPFRSGFSSTPLKIVIDCLNGATGPFAAALFSSHPNLCSNVIVLNAVTDGNFPNGNPDPTEENRLRQLSKAVVKNQADIGLSFDGDGDRLMVVDAEGEVISPDHLLYLLARVAIEDHAKSMQPTKNRKPTVIFDVKCSHHLPLLIEQAGAVGQMSKTGSSILRRALQNNNPETKSKVIFAGELSGHYIFNDGHFLLHDDAMYAGLRLLNWLQQQPLTLAETIKSLPALVTTPDVYLPLADYAHSVSSPAKDSVKQEGSQPILTKLSTMCLKLQANLNNFPTPLPADARLTCIDGLRLDFKHGFGIIRSSNTSNSLTVRFAGDSVSDLKSVQHYFVSLCQSISQDLASQVANIRVKQ